MALSVRDDFSLEATPLFPASGTALPHAPSTLPRSRCPATARPPFHTKSLDTTAYIHGGQCAFEHRKTHHSAMS
jgi:hypothetical protein